MTTKETNTSTSLPETTYESSDRTFEAAPDETSSQSNFVEIDFPKSRTIKFTESKEVVRISVNYEKVDAQLKIYNANSSSI